ncbi:mitochondrial ribosomal protein S31 [Cotesia typhae]|uniref:mitochondrial ribosomal protein S31 n=1 Tax=Cotesia typhae TaxID=2053667 RepID=UPI003D68F99C
MNNLLVIQFIYRHAICRSKINHQQLCMAQRLMSSKDSLSSSSSSDSSDSDSNQNETKKIKKVKKLEIVERSETEKKETVDLLNSLLTNMNSVKIEDKTIRAVPKKERKPKPPKEPELEEKIIIAAKDVAAVLGGDPEKTEAELLNKVFSAGKPTRALENKEDSIPVKPSKLTLEELFSKMQVERKPKILREMIPLSRSQKIQELIRNSRSPNHPTNQTLRSEKTQVNLFHGKRLNIFDPVKAPEDSPMLSTWSSLEKKEIKTMMINTPENIFEEMIQWTDKGMLWQFPINNEFGLEEEEKVHFSEHVFLERYLQGWCPKTGPIRHFMDLVCIGLSKNPYMTVNEKEEHIMWLKEWFADKQDLLKEIGAIDQDIIPNTSKQIPT